jgi:hypothetical protein
MMGIARAGSKSDYRRDETWTRGTSLKELIEIIPTNVARVSAGVGCSTSAAGGDVEETCGSQIALLEPPMSQTKGCGTRRYGNRSASGAERLSTSTYKRKRTDDGMEIIGKRLCGTCGVKGHYTTTYPRNPNITHAVERKGMEIIGKRTEVILKNQMMTHSKMYHLLRMMITMLMSRAVACVICFVETSLWMCFCHMDSMMMKLINVVFVGVNSASLLNLFCWYHVF